MVTVGEREACDTARRTAMGVENEVGEEGQDHEKMQASSASKPVIFAVDGGAGSFRRIEYGLRRRYGGEYQVVCESSAMWGMKRLQEIKTTGDEVALILADQWMPDITGAEFLVEARRLFPAAKRALVVK